VAGPESANNAATSGAFVPMLALGVPGVPVAALMLAAMMIHGVNPGPLLIKNEPQVFWAFIASMYVGNVILLILNLPMVGLFVNVLRIPYPVLYPIVLVSSILGVYAVNNSLVDVWIMIGFGAIGYVLRKLEFESAPIVLGLVLAPMLELALRQSLSMSGGSYAIFVTRPISVTLLAAGAVLVALALRPLVTHTLDWRARLPLQDETR
jgi:putative tricarboxylic transport membrane protein